MTGAGDPDAARRLRLPKGLARNPSAPPSVLAELIRFPAVAAEVARRRGDLTDDLAAAILALDDPDAAASLGHNDRTPTSVRRRLAVHPDPQVPAAAARRGLPENIPPGCEVPRTCSPTWPTTSTRTPERRPPDTRDVLQFALVRVTGYPRLGELPLAAPTQKDRRTPISADHDPYASPSDTMG